MPGAVLFMVYPAELKTEPVITLELLPRWHSWRFRCLITIPRVKCQVFIQHWNEAYCTGDFPCAPPDHFHPPCSFYPGALTCQNPSGFHGPAPWPSRFHSGVTNGRRQQELQSRRRMSFKYLFIPPVLSLPDRLRVAVSSDKRSQLLLQAALSFERKRTKQFSIWVL